MYSRHPLAFYLTWVVALVILPLPLILILATGLSVSATKLVSYSFGTMAYVWWLVAVALSARPQWLDRKIGLPEIYFIHGMLGVLALIVATIHVLQSNTHKVWVYWTGQIAWILAIIGIVYAAFFLSGWFVDRLPLVREAKRRITRILTHQVSIWVHRLHFVAIGLILIHMHASKPIANLTGFLPLIHAYTWPAVGLYVWAKWIAPRKQAHRAYVVSNTPLNHDTHQVVLCLDERAPVYEPGDFYFLRFKGANVVSGEPHPFSVTYTPEIEAAKVAALANEGSLAAHTRLLTFTIRELGDFTQHIGKVPVDTTVWLEGPFGRFNRVLRDDPDHQRLVLIGMGTGIAPILSLALGYAHKRPTTVFHTVHHEDDFYYVDRFTELAEAYPHNAYHHKVHRYTPEDLASMLGDELTTARYVIVGGASAVLDSLKMLVAMGVPAKNIIDERLTM